MKFKITDWIKNENISPLNWGDSVKEICNLFKNSSKEIISLKERNYPYIILDFVEFYFTDTINFIDLNEIIIKPMSLYNGIRTKYIEAGWLSRGLTFEVVSKKLTGLKLDWYIERGPHFNTPNIRTVSGQFFAFEKDGHTDKKAELLKIYLKKQIT